MQCSLKGKTKTLGFDLALAPFASQTIGSQSCSPTIATYMLESFRPLIASLFSFQVTSRYQSLEGLTGSTPDPVNLSINVFSHAVLKPLYPGMFALLFLSPPTFSFPIPPPPCFRPPPSTSPFSRRSFVDSKPVDAKRNLILPLHLSSFFASH